MLAGPLGVLGVLGGYISTSRADLSWVPAFAGMSGNLADPIHPASISTIWRTSQTPSPATCMNSFTSSTASSRLAALRKA